MKRLTMFPILIGLTLVLAGPGHPALQTYYNDTLWGAYSDSCYYASGEACSGWNYWDYNIVLTGHSSAGGVHDSGNVIAGFDNNTTIRGVYKYALTSTDYIAPGRVLEFPRFRGQGLIRQLVLVR